MTKFKTHKNNKAKTFTVKGAAAIRAVYFLGS